MTAASLGRNHHFSDAFSQDYLGDPRNCPVEGLASLKDNSDPGQIDLPAFFKQVPAYVLLSL